MPIKSIIKDVLPSPLKRYLRKKLSRPTQARKDSNKWLKNNCRDIQGKVLSIGSGNDSDGENNFYKNYFPLASSYTTSETSDQFNSDLILDVRSMQEAKDEFYDCIFCSGVLEHVDDYQAGFKELTRILKIDGILLLGLPFRQAIHMSPQDFWRFTEFGIKYLLKDSYELIEIISIDARKNEEFPAAYWVKAKKIR